MINFILTPNRRLSATLLRQKHADHIKQGYLSWKTPNIYPLATWCEMLWQACIRQQPQKIRPILLTTNQEKLLWEKIVASSPEGEQLLQPHTTAGLAYKAWTLIKLWRIDITDSLFQLTEDTAAFQRWGLSFQAHCKQNNWLDTASLVDQLLQEITENVLSLPETISLAGFTEVAPQHQALFDLLVNKGCCVQPLNVLPKITNECVVNVADEVSEILTLARWAKKILNDSPAATIGCIIPRLDVLRDDVLKIFSEVFSEPGTLSAYSIHLPFNISAGKKLSDWPILQTALLLCESLNRELTSEEQVELDCSPFIKNYSNIKYKINDFRLLPAQWAQEFSTFLNSRGWPGERSLNSEEYQLCQRWLDLLNEYSTLDLFFHEIDLKSALNCLQRLADYTVFQPQSPLAPIQISGVLEAAGQPFSHLWLMGMDDSQWPFPPRPNPFIPLVLQRDLQMPHATSERELHYCQTLFQQLRDQTTHLICSYANQQDDTLLRPTPLIEGLPRRTVEDLLLDTYITPAEYVFAAKTTEMFTDAVAPAVTQAEIIRGGMPILRHQANCPFRAFAEIRLHAKRKEPEVIGLSPKIRGILLHKALELAWQQLKDSHTLQQISEAMLQQLSQNWAYEAMQHTLKQQPTDSRYLTLEWERMTQLVSSWLSHEKNRPPFRVISCEKTQTLTLGDLTLDCRMDRIDELADGTQLIIDYKTGKNSSFYDWMGDRPGEPQLPLYCISTPHTISGLAYATIHPENLGFSGLSANDIGMTLKTIATWQTQLKEWETTLTKIAADFQNGIATVDPKENETCAHCHLQPLCRIHERIYDNS